MKTPKLSRSNRIRWQREKSMERVLPSHVWRWIRTGVIAPELKRYVKTRSEDVAAMIQDLGGPDCVSAMERAALDGWLQAQVTADVLFARFLQTDDVRAIKSLSSYLNTARNQLSLIGLTRREREVLDLDEYLEVRAANKSPENANVEGGPHAAT